MGLDLKKKKHDPIRTTLTFPWSDKQVERYRSLSNELDKKGYESLHSLARERLEKLLDEVEETLSAS